MYAFRSIQIVCLLSLLCASTVIAQWVQTTGPGGVYFCRFDALSPRDNTLISFVKKLLLVR